MLHTSQKQGCVDSYYECNSLAIDTHFSRKYLSALTVLNTGEYCGKYYEQNPVDGGLVVRMF